MSAFGLPNHYISFRSSLVVPFSITLNLYAFFSILSNIILLISINAKMICHFNEYHLNGLRY